MLPSSPTPVSAPRVPPSDGTISSSDPIVADLAAIGGIGPPGTRPHVGAGRAEDAAAIGRPTAPDGARGAARPEPPPPAAEAGAIAPRGSEPRTGAGAKAEPVDVPSQAEAAGAKVEPVDVPSQAEAAGAKAEPVDVPSQAEAAGAKVEPVDVPSQAEAAGAKAEPVDVPSQAEAAGAKVEPMDVPSQAEAAGAKTEPVDIEPLEEMQGSLQSPERVSRHSEAPEEALKPSQSPGGTPKLSQPPSRPSSRRSSTPSRASRGRTQDSLDAVLDATMQQAIANALEDLLKPVSGGGDATLGPGDVVPGRVVVDGASAKQADKAAALIVHQLDTHSALSTLRACREPVDSFVKCLAAGAFATLSDASGPLGEALAAAASAYEAAHPEVRRGRARQAAASFGESLAAAIVRSAGAGRGGGLAVLEGRSSRAATAGAAAEGQATHRISLPPCVLANREPFRSGEWRKEPYPRRRYEPVEVSDVAEPLVRHEVDVRTRVVVEDRASDIPDFGTPGAVVHAGAAGQGFADARAALEDLRSSVASVLRLQGATADQARGLLQAVSERRPLRLGDDVLEVDSWGIDCYTRRNIQDAALQSGAFGKWRAPDYRRILASLRAAQPAKKKGRAPSRAPSRTGGSDDGDDGDDDEALGSARGGSPGTAVAAAAASDGAAEVARAQVEVEARAARWIERSVMPALNAQGANGWDLGAALAALQADPGAWGEAGRRAAAAVAARLERIGTNYFQVHPKGVGVVVSPRGRAVPPFTFVEEYLGEVHPAWRWYELQDAVKRASGAELPDFYNIALERPKHDPSGYDVLFVDASRRGTLASRVSHSCGPNCAAVPLRSRGRLRIALYTLREVAPGEELTFDYACVSESEREFREAICLCGSVGCRGSYLYYTGSRSFSAVLAARHCSLDRTALVLRAGLEPLSDADRARLRAEGVGDACLCDPRHDGRRVPAWLEKWAALALEFGELEERLLRDVLAADARGLYTPEAAAAEAAGVRANRLQSLAITLDKVKLYLAAPGQPLGAPLTPLTEAETLEHLWHGERGIARRALLGILDQVAPGAARRLRRAGGVLLCPEDLSGEVPVPFQAAVAVLAGPASTAAEARERLALAVEAVRAADLEAGGGLTALADLLVLYAATKTWFSHDRSYKGFSSPPLPRSLVREHLPAHSGTARPSSAEALKPAALSKTYRPGYVWGQLSMWHKQTVADPTASLSADRRGALSLPDVESAFCGAQYTGYERSELLGQLERRPDAIWKVWMCWSFRNDAKIYGSPMFDDALARSRAGWARLAPDGQPAMAEPGEGAGSLAEALAHLKCAELPPRMRDTKRAPKAAKRKAPKSRQS